MPLAYINVIVGF